MTVTTVYDIKILLYNINHRKETHVNKNELISAVAKQAEQTKADIARVLDATLEVITYALKKGDKVKLVGLGSLRCVKKAARRGVNPKTKEPIDIPAKISVRFKAGDTLLQEVKKVKIK